MKHFRVEPGRLLDPVAAGLVSFADWQDGFIETTANFPSRIDMALITASEAKMLSSGFSLVPILDSISEGIIEAAGKGLYATSFQVSDSIYALHIAQIVASLQANGYNAVAGAKGVISIDWSAAS